MKIIYHSQFFISFCAVAMSLETLYMGGIRTHISPLIVWIFASTQFIYISHLLIGSFHILKNCKGLLNLPLTRSMLFFCALDIGLFSGSFFALRPATQACVLLPCLVSLAYILPIFHKKNKRLRDIGFLKTWAVVFTWVYVTVVLPFVEYDMNYNGGVLLERGLFLTILMLAFEMRDAPIDQAQEVRTIAGLLGSKKIEYLIYTLAFIWCWVVYLLYPFHYKYFFVSIFFTLLVLKKILSMPRKAIFFAYWADGMMLLQFLLVYSDSFL